MEKKANLNLQNDKGVTVLQSAVCNEQVAVARLLLTREEIKVNDPFQKTKIKSTFNDGYNHFGEAMIEEKTALYFAVDIGNLPLINELLNAGAMAKDEFNLPLTTAVKKGDNRVVQLLLEHGANIDGKNVCGERPLDIAIQYGHYDSVQMLLEYGAKIINESDQEEGVISSLTLAYSNGQMEIARLLTENGAEITPYEVGKTLKIAIKNGFQDVIVHLLNHVIDVNVLNKFGATFLRTAIKKENIDTVKILLDKGIDLNSTGCFDELPLVLATKQKLIPVVELLLKNGADINVCDGQGKTAAYYSVVDSGSLHIWEIFLNFVGSVSEIAFTDSDETALVDRVTELNYTLIKFLILKGANVNAKDQYGRTPLYSLVENLYFRQKESDWMDCAELLIEGGADILCTDDEDDEATPLKTVIENCSVEAVKMFLEKGLKADKDNRESIAPILCVLIRNSHVSLIGPLLYKVFDFCFEEKFSKISYLEVQDESEWNREIIKDLQSKSISVLHCAAYKGNVNLLNVALECDLNIDVLTKESFTPLQTALYKCNFELAKCLIDKGANVNIRDKYGLLPIHVAIIHGDISVLEQLYDKTNLNDCCVLGVPLLHFVAHRSNVVLLNLMLSKGTDINTRDETNNTVLHIAVKIQSCELINVLFEKGVDGNVKNESGDTALLAALKMSSSSDSSKFNVVNTLLRHGVDINVTDSDQKTALHLAVGLKSDQLITLLLEKGTQSVSARDKNGLSPFIDLLGKLRLENTFLSDPTEMVILFLKHGAQIEGPTNRGSSHLTCALQNKIIDVKRIIQACGINICSKMSPQEKYDLLNQAVNENRPDLIELMLSQGFTFNSIHTPFEPHKASYVFLKKNNKHLTQLILNKDEKLDLSAVLMKAVKNTNVDLIKTLLDKVDANTPIRWYEKPFEGMYSIEKLKTYGLVQLFLDRGVKVNSSSNTFYVPFVPSARAGNCWLINTLLDKGAGVNNKTFNDYSALHASVIAEDKYMVQTLLARGADVNIADVYKRTPLYSAAHNGNNEIVKMLLDNGAKLEEKETIVHKTPLHIASVNGRYTTVKLLIDSGANISATDKQGNTPLHTTKSPEVAKVLINQGASVTTENCARETPLHRASILNLLPSSVATPRPREVCKVLIENGAVVDVRDKDGRTPLHRAASEGHSDVIQVLIDNGAKIDMVDYYGKTALHHAVYKNELGNVKSLLANGASTDIKDANGHSCYTLPSNSNFPSSKRFLGKFFLKQQLAGISNDERVIFGLSSGEEATCLKELDMITQTVIGKGFCLYEVFSGHQNPSYLSDLELVQQIDALFQSKYLDQYRHYGLVLRHMFIRSKQSAGLLGNVCI